MNRRRGRPRRRPDGYRHRWPDGNITDVRIGYVQDQFVRAERTVIVEHTTASDDLFGRKVWVVGCGTLRCISDAGGTYANDRGSLP